MCVCKCKYTLRLMYISIGLNENKVALIGSRLAVEVGGLGSSSICA